MATDNWQHHGAIDVPISSSSAANAAAVNHDFDSAKMRRIDARLLDEVVIKPHGKTLKGAQSVVGATITGNRHIALVLDIPGLIGAYGYRQ